MIVDIIAIVVFLHRLNCPCHKQCIEFTFVSSEDVRLFKRSINLILSLFPPLVLEVEVPIFFQFDEECSVPFAYM